MPQVVPTWSKVATVERAAPDRPLRALTLDERRLIDGAADGDAELVVQLLASGVDVDASEPEEDEAAVAARAAREAAGEKRRDVKPGQTALHKAVCFGHVGVAQLLCEAGADTRMPDRAFREPWYYAAFSASAPDGTHAALMRVLFQFEKTATADLLLLASFSSRPGVMEALLDEMVREVVSRDSNDHCVLRFHDLHLLDDDRHVCTWPDGSYSKAGLTAFGELVNKAQKQENQKRLLTHPTVLGLMYCKWERYAKRVFAIELSLYLLLVLAMSASLVVRTGSGTMDPEGSKGLALVVLEAVALGASALLLLKWWAEQSAQSLEREHILSRAIALLNILLPIVGIASAWLGEGQDSVTLSVNAFAIVFLWIGLVKYLESARTVGSVGFAAAVAASAAAAATRVAAFHCSQASSC